MNRLTDEQMDKIIKAKFKNDNQISDKANSVFANFNLKNNNQFNNDSVEQIKTNNEQTIKHEIKDKSQTINNVGKKIIEVSFYQKLNRILSVAAVSLTVVLVGGSVLYFNKGGKNNSINQSETITYNQKYLVQNEKLEVSNEKINKEVEHGFVKVYMLGKQDIGINLTSTYWNQFDVEVKSTDCYKVANITENVSDIFIGEIGGAGMPYVFLLMEDGTIEYVDLHCYRNNVFFFEATKIEGLNDVVGFEQKSRKYSYSNTDYEYVNAIRKDGLRKEIEIGIVNNWNDIETVNFNKLNEKYIKAHNKEAIVDDGKGDFTVDNADYYRINGETEYIYCKRNNNLYRIRKSDYNEECIATGINGMARDNADGRISFYVGDRYEIYSLDKNIVFKNRNEQVINQVTTNKQNNTNQTTNNQTQGNTDYSVFSSLANSDYKNESFKTKYGQVVYCYEIKFDRSGKPTIRISSVEDGYNETIFETKEITNIKQDVAAGTSYVTFDFTAFTPGGNTTGTAKMRFSNVAENDSVGIKATVKIDNRLQDFNNSGDYVYVYRSNFGGNTAKEIKKLSPSGWAGSSMQEVKLYDNGDVYHVTYNGNGNTAENIINSELIARNAETIEEKGNGLVVEAIIVKGKKLSIVRDNEAWIIFQNN